MLQEFTLSTTYINPELTDPYPSSPHILPEPTSTLSSASRLETEPIPLATHTQQEVTPSRTHIQSEPTLYTTHTQDFPVSAR